MEDARQTVTRFIYQNFYVADGQQIGGAESLLERGIIDSTGVLEVIGFLEERFGITVDDSDMLPENLDTIDGIVAFVARKTVER